MEENQPSARELQLELQIWMEHKTALETKGQLLQAQAALLQAEGQRTEENVKRLQALLAPKAAPDAPVNVEPTPETPAAEAAAD